MSRAITILLEVGIVVTSIAAIFFAAKIILEQTIGGSWYWGGAIAAFTGPALFALALNLYQRSAGAAKAEASQ